MGKRQKIRGLTMKKFPRTVHLSFSPGFTEDDLRSSSEDNFVNQDIVLSYKLDGELCGMTRENCHARSLDSKDHPSRHYVKQLWGHIRHQIPIGCEVYGENMFARHSIYYDKLTAYFYVFAIREENKFLSWDYTVEYAALLNLPTVPVYYEGPWDENKIKSFWPLPPVFGDTCEGYVIRTRKDFPYEDFGKHTAKFVRENHVTTSEHWMRGQIVPNKLIEFAHSPVYKQKK